MKKLKLKKPLPPPPKRTRGQKAGLSRAQIIATALKLAEQGQLNILAIAKALGVAPAAIYVKFPGKGAQIVTETFQSVLADVARPFHPNETWEAYLRSIFGATFHAFNQRGHLALAFGNELSANYFLNPLLVERILHALSLAGVPETKKAKALDLVMTNLIGFVAIQRMGLGESGVQQWLDGQSKLIDDLSSSEYPQIKTLKTQLMKAAKERSEQVSATKSLPRSTMRLVDFLIEGLKAQI